MNLIASLDETFKMIPGELIQTYSCCTGELSKNVKDFTNYYLQMGQQISLFDAPVGYLPLKELIMIEV